MSKTEPSSGRHEPSEEYALSLDAADPLCSERERFCIPGSTKGDQPIYFCGNSLGLMSKDVRQVIDQELKDWAELGVDGHFEGKTPWYSYHEVFRETAARLVGAKPGEVVMMNSLTINLHLMMVSFYRPTKQRYKILIDGPTFPSDIYAVKSQLQHHGFDPEDALVVAMPRTGEHTLRIEDIEAILEHQGEQIALLMAAGVNFFTGQVADMPALVSLARRFGCVVGFDLAHAAGNIPLQLHDWGPDFAVWCNYKYLNSGPGAVAGCFVHERHGQNSALNRFAGWWGNDPETRFKMHLLPDFVPQAGAEGWQISNPPILGLAPLQSSLAIFDRVGMPALRTKSELLTGYLQYLIQRMPNRNYEVITPNQPSERGCQLSILASQDPEQLFEALQARRIVGDFRRPNVIRVAPVPLYNTFHEVWRFANILAEQATKSS